MSSLYTENEKVTSANVKIYEEIPKDKIEFLNNNKNISATLVMPEISKKNFSLVNVELWTGKKHQIRAHLSSIGNPLLGDKKYQTKESKIISDRLSMDSYYLHAYKMEIENYPMWTAPMPEDFKNKIESLCGK